MSGGNKSDKYTLDTTGKGKVEDQDGASKTEGSEEKTKKLIISIASAVVPYIFVVWIYFWPLRGFFVTKTGYSGREILFWQSIFLIVVVGIVWNLILSNFSASWRKIGKACILTSLLFLLVTAGDMYFRPYDFFEHRPKGGEEEKNGEEKEKTQKEKENGKIPEKKAQKASEEKKGKGKASEEKIQKASEEKNQDKKKNCVVKPKSKFWVAKEGGRIIDVSYSEGVSRTYGKLLKEGTLEDVDGAIRFIKSTSKIPFLYGTFFSSSRSKSWQTVFTHTYTGKGLDGATYIETVQSGKELKQGDKIIITGEAFQAYNGVWQKHRGHCEIICKTPDNGKFFYIAAEKEMEVTLEIQRFM